MQTKVVVEIVAQEVARGRKVLVAAPSNIAVDNVVARVRDARPKSKVVRAGHPARLLPEVEEASLERQALSADDASLALDAAKERRELQAKMEKMAPSRKREAKKELTTLNKEAKRLYDRAVSR